jgi:hypothetical protein
LLQLKHDWLFGGTLELSYPALPLGRAIEKFYGTPSMASFARLSSRVVCILEQVDGIEALLQ